MTARPMEPKPGTRSAMDDALALGWAEIWTIVPSVIASGRPKHVHALRVASRRLRATLDLADTQQSKAVVRLLRRAAKNITSSAGDVRDCDVLLIALKNRRRKAQKAERPAIDYLMARISARRKKARRVMVAYLRSLEKQDLPATTRRLFPEPRVLETAGESS